MSQRGLSRLGAQIAERLNAELAKSEPDERIRRAVFERAARHAARTRTSRPMVSAGVAALLAAAMAAGVVLMLRPFVPRPLSFTVGREARPGVVSSWVSAVDVELPVRFSDGTVVRLEPGARAQVAQVDPNGADIVLESGLALVDVVPNRGGAWRVLAGPFVIEVKGTRFDVGWDAERKELALDLFEGSVLLKGCGLVVPRAVERAELVRLSCPGPGDVSSQRSARPPEPRDEVGVTPEPVPPGRSAARAVAPSRDGSWRSLARDGHFKKAYEIAEAAGFEAECEGASAADSTLLGDTARLSGRADDAAYAYLSVRRRFPEGDAAARAAFALGRLAFDSGSPPQAMRWFETYLVERPAGSLAASAFDRLLEASVRAGDSGRTRSIAERYLARYPGGARASEARRILELGASSNEP